MALSSMALSRVARAVVRARVPTRAGFSHSARMAAATNFAMPAMSPTMTEGGVIQWNFKEGDSFSSGDVLLEIETDKAQIEVEAQDDGVIAKIYAQPGEKGIPVGKTIAVIAEPGDDIASLELPAQEQGGSSQPEPEQTKPEAPKEAEAPKETPTPAKTPKASKASSGAPSASGKADPSQTLLPSVAGLIKEHDLSRTDALEKIPASGPNGRLLKGDVLAYFGTVSQDTVNNLNSQIKKLQALDLSNIKLREPSKPAATSAESKDASAASKKEPKGPTVLKEVYSLTDINLLKTTLDSTLSTAISVESLVEKAAKSALSDVPVLSQSGRSVLRDPVFESLLAPTRPGKAFEYTLTFPRFSAASKTRGDIYDILASPRKPLSPVGRSARLSPSDLLKVDVTVNAAVPGSEARANIFLERLGYYLTEGKGDLVL